MSGAVRQESLQSLVTQFGAFLTVAIHMILFERNLYPAQSFLTARAYNFPVRQSRHPGVCTWVADAVSAVVLELLKGTVARVAFVIFHPATSKPLERFVWDVSSWPVMPKSEWLIPMTREDGSEKAAVPLNVDLDEQLRGLLSRLSTCGSRLAAIPQGCDFTLSVELKDDADPPVGHPQPWIPSEPSLQRTKLDAPSEGDTDGDHARKGDKVKRGDALGGAKTISVRKIEAGELRFQMWIEEGKAKSEDQDESANSSNSASAAVGATTTAAAAAAAMAVSS